MMCFVLLLKVYFPLCILLPMLFLPLCVFALPLCVSSCLSLCLLLPAQCVFYPPLLAPTGRIIDASDLELSVLVADPIPATERNGWKTRVQRSFYVCWTLILDGS